MNSNNVVTVILSVFLAVAGSFVTVMTLGPDPRGVNESIQSLHKALVDQRDNLDDLNAKTTTLNELLQEVHNSASLHVKVTEKATDAYNELFRKVDARFVRLEEAVQSYATSLQAAIDRLNRLERFHDAPAFPGKPRES